MSQNPFPNRIESGVLGRWIIRVFIVGLAAGVVVGIVALLN